MKVEMAIEEFLAIYPSMSLKPTSSMKYIIEGDFPVVAQFQDDSTTWVNRSFHLRIEVPIAYPDRIPIVYEMKQGAQIPTSPDYHKNNDDSLCLGSPLDLLIQLYQNPSLVVFANTCIAPHLASAILKKEKGISFKQGELKHYGEGLEENFADFFSINVPLKSLPLIFKRLGEKRRKANKQPCPCGGQKLGSCTCSIHRCISSERRRKRFSRRFFRNVSMYYDCYINSQKEKSNSQNKSLVISN